MESNRLRVFARIRPALPREVSNSSFTRCLGVPKNNHKNKNGSFSENDPNTIIVTTTDKPILLNESGSNSNAQDGLLRYELDGVIEESSNNSQVFNQICYPLITGLQEGINGCLFSYGQTGSGKTHTMMGDGNVGKDVGLIILTARELLKEINISNNNSNNNHISSCDNESVQNNEKNIVDDNKAKLSMSYVQIYGKEITDLLANNTNIQTESVSRKTKSNNRGDTSSSESRSSRSDINNNNNNLSIRDNGDEVYVEGLSRWNINEIDELIELLNLGNKKRIVGNTKLNIQSSRSHAIITFYYECSEFNPHINKESNGKEREMRSGAKLHLVDLAGSERVKDSQVTGKSLKEVSLPYI